MPDKLTIEQRHNNMAAIRAKDTKPEIVVRRFLWSRGFRYRLNHKRLPGKPDVVLRKYRTCIFVNGCFWHGHHIHIPFDNSQCTISSNCCKIPKTRREFWVRKITRNKERDAEVQRKLAEMGWHCITVWECELKPSRRERTLEALAFTLNHIFLQDHKVMQYVVPEEDGVVMAAEESYFCNDMKTINVVAAIIIRDGRVFATQRGYGEWKDWWEFPGGKIEEGEKPEEALKREIREELATEIEVGEWLTTVEYDYPKFHLSMQCFLCRTVAGELSLLEHEDARWLALDDLDSVEWLPADLEILPLIKKNLGRE